MKILCFRHQNPWGGSILVILENKLLSQQHLVNLHSHKMFVHCLDDTVCIFVNEH